MTAAPDLKRRELAQIHIAKKELGMDDETYYAMLWSIGRVRHSNELDYTGRKRVLDHLKSRGFRVKRGKPATRERANDWAFVDRAAADRQPLLKKLIMVCKAGNKSKAYADSTCNRMHGIERVELAAPDQLRAIVAAIIKQNGREQQRVSGA